MHRLFRLGPHHDLVVAGHQPSRREVEEVLQRNQRDGTLGRVDRVDHLFSARSSGRSAAERGEQSLEKGQKVSQRLVRLHLESRPCASGGATNEMACGRSGPG